MFNWGGFKKKRNQESEPGNDASTDRDDVKTVTSKTSSSADDRSEFERLQREHTDLIQRQSEAEETIERLRQESAEQIQRLRAESEEQRHNEIERILSEATNKHKEEMKQRLAEMEKQNEMALKKTIDNTTRKVTASTGRALKSNQQEMEALKAKLAERNELVRELLAQKAVIEEKESWWKASRDTAEASGQEKVQRVGAAFYVESESSTTDMKTSASAEDQSEFEKLQRERMELIQRQSEAEETIVRLRQESTEQFQRLRAENEEQRRHEIERILTKASNKHKEEMKQRLAEMEKQNEKALKITIDTTTRRVSVATGKALKSTQQEIKNLKAQLAERDDLVRELLAQKAVREEKESQRKASRDKAEASGQEKVLGVGAVFYVESESSITDVKTSSSAEDQSEFEKLQKERMDLIRRQSEAEETIVRLRQESEEQIQRLRAESEEQRHSEIERILTKASNKHKEEMKQRLAEMEKQNEKALKSIIDNTTRKVSAATGKALKSTQQEIKTLKARLAERDEQMKELQDKLTEAAVEERKSQELWNIAKHKQLSEQLKDKEDSLDAATAEVEFLRGRLEKSEEEVRQLHEKNEQLKLQYDQLNEDFQQHREQPQETCQLPREPYNQPPKEGLEQAFKRLLEEHMQLKAEFGQLKIIADMKTQMSTSPPPPGFNSSVDPDDPQIQDGSCMQALNPTHHGGASVTASSLGDEVPSCRMLCPGRSFDMDESGKPVTQKRRHTHQVDGGGAAEPHTLQKHIAQLQSRLDRREAELITSKEDNECKKQTIETLQKTIEDDKTTAKKGLRGTDVDKYMERVVDVTKQLTALQNEHSKKLNYVAQLEQEVKQLGGASQSDAKLKDLEVENGRLVERVRQLEQLVPKPGQTSHRERVERALEQSNQSDSPPPTMGYNQQRHLQDQLSQIPKLQKEIDSLEQQVIEQITASSLLEQDNKKLKEDTEMQSSRLASVEGLLDEMEQENEELKSQLKQSTSRRPESGSRTVIESESSGMNDSMSELFARFMARVDELKEELQHKDEMMKRIKKRVAKLTVAMPSTDPKGSSNDPQQDAAQGGNKTAPQLSSEGVVGGDTEAEMLTQGSAPSSCERRHKKRRDEEAEQLKAKVAALTVDVNHRDVKIDNLSRQLQSFTQLMKDFAQIQKHSQKQSRIIIELKKQLDEQKKAAMDLNSALSESQQENQELKTQQMSVDTTIRRLTTKNAELKQQVEKLAEQAQDYSTSKYQELEWKHQEIVEQVTELQKTLATLQEERTGLMEKADKMSEVKERRDYLEQVVINHKAVIANTQQALQTAQDKATTLVKEKEGLENQLFRIMKEKEELLSEVEVHRLTAAVLPRYQVQISSLRSQTDEMRKQIAELEDEVQSRTQQGKQYKKMIDSYKDELAVSREQAGEHKKQETTFTQQVEALNKKLEDAAREIDVSKVTLRETKSKYQVQILSLRSQTDQMRKQLQIAELEFAPHSKIGRSSQYNQAGQKGMVGTNQGLACGNVSPLQQQRQIMSGPSPTLQYGALKQSLLELEDTVSVLETKKKAIYSEYCNQLIKELALSHENTKQLESRISDLESKVDDRILQQSEKMYKQSQSAIQHLQEQIHWLNNTLLHWYRIPKMVQSSRDKLKPFVIQEPVQLGANVGRGCYGAVYSCTIGNVNIKCIAKRIHNALVGGGEYEGVSDREKSTIRSNFQRECTILSTARHPNVVQFVGVCYGSDQHDLQLIMERLATDLEKLLAACREENERQDGFKLPLSFQVSFLSDISSGLLYLHSQSILHRDLNSGNVLLTADLQAKIADLGVSKLHPEDSQKLTQAPGASGYMAPEALEKNPVYDEKIDVYSFGVLSLYIATQNFPAVSQNHVPDRIHDKGEGEIFKRQEWVDALKTQQHPFHDLVRQCLLEKRKRPQTTDVVEIVRRMREAHQCTIKETLNVFAHFHDLTHEKNLTHNQCNS